MTYQLALLANVVISAAYFAISWAILSPLVRVGQVRSNRLGAATAAIFFSCAVGHAFHAVHAATPLPGEDLHAVSPYVAVWDLTSAVIAVYYWSLRRVYGRLMEGAALFEDLAQRERMLELEHRVEVAQVKAQAERERDAHAAMLTAVIAHSQSLIWVRDLQGRYLLANDAFERAFDVREPDLLGQSREFLRRTDDAAGADRCGPSGQVESEREYDAPDGRHVYESVTFPLFDPDGERYATCGIALDVTARRRADDETARARDAALASAAAKSSFLATMSHEIRTPMNAVIGMTGLLLDTPLDARQRDFVETVRASGDALLSIINDILDYSKIEAGELHLERQAFDLRACAEGSMDLVAQAAAAKGLDLVLELSPTCPQRLVGDASRLRQVLVNLLSNAVKFTARGEVVLSVDADVADGLADLRCRVRDTGIGIPADRMSRLFQSFSQVDASTTRLYGGTGLGLVISRRLVQAMGGDLQAVSEAGRGSCFTATACLAVAPAPEPAPARLAGRSVLVVEDNATSRAALEVHLAGWGCRTTSAAGPVEALELVDRAGPFDVAVLDAHLPGMDGDQLAVALRALPHGRELPLVLLTSLGDGPAPDGAGHVAHVPKPARQAALASALLRAVSGDVTGVAEERPAVPAPAAAGPRLRVLLAEDNPVNQKVACLMLAGLGHHVDAVGDGREAVQALRTAPYDVVLMDVQMPHMDGLEATRVIRTVLAPERQPRIVALTASALLEDREACTRAGMDDHLAKPVRQEQLARVLTADDRGRVPAQAPTGRGRAVVLPDGPGSFDPRTVDAFVASVGGDAQLRDELLRTYLADADQRTEELVVAARAGDGATAARAAHALRSGTELLGLAHLAGLLAAVEADGRAGQDVRPLAEQVRGAQAGAAAGIRGLLAGPVLDAGRDAGPVLNGGRAGPVLEAGRDAGLALDARRDPGPALDARHDACPRA